MVANTPQGRPHKVEPVISMGRFFAKKVMKMKPVTAASEASRVRRYPVAAVSILEDRCLSISTNRSAE